MTVVSINPTTGETLETFAETTPAALERVLDEAVAAYQTWRRCSYAHRAKLVREAARLLRERKSQHARTMALEMGKPLPQGEAEAEKCAWVCDYYAEHAERFLADEPRETDASKAFVRFDPIGPVLAIMPWNFPFWQVFRFAAPALMAGNAGLVNSGQSCIAAKRFIVVEPVADRFLDAFVPAMRARRMGDPLASGTQIGPQARHDLRANLHRQVEESVRRGARLLLGGTLPEGPGFFYAPTVLASVEEGMPAFDEEVFGPVAVVIRVKDESRAVRVANASRYGLGAAVWTGDTARGERLARELEVGSVFVNGLVKSDPRLPFGGVKVSGYGRGPSEAGLTEFVDIKTSWVA